MLIIQAVNKQKKARYPVVTRLLIEELVILDYCLERNFLNFLVVIINAFNGVYSFCQLTFL